MKPALIFLASVIGFYAFFVVITLDNEASWNFIIMEFSAFTTLLLIMAFA